MHYPLTSVLMLSTLNTLSPELELWCDETFRSIGDELRLDNSLVLL
jgi:hypothetical protein